jgi:hypothetical protein
MVVIAPGEKKVLQAMATPKSGMLDIVKASFARIFGH